MALVCDFKSENSHTMTESSLEDSLKPEPTASDDNQKNDSPQKEDDLEDGEIEDDDEEEPTEPVVSEPQQNLGENLLRSRSPSPVLNNKNNKFGHPVGGKANRFDRGADRRNRYEERKHGHLTEAEKSVLHLRKLERLEREKRERYKREQNPAVDDFASNIEKAIANVLKKDKKGGSEDEKDEEEKRGKKRKKKDKDKRKNKQRKVESPNLEEVDENELLNMRKGGSPDQRKIRTRSSSPHSPSEFDSRESSPASDRSREERKDTKSYKKDSKKKNNERNRNDKRKRDHKTDIQQNKESGGAQAMLCTFYMQGKCTKGDDCTFSHGVSAPIKMELCKFYLMDCCAKGDKCLYMHSQFPCKFYHTGIVCKAGDFCKFSHGKQLSEAHKQILFKHIETAPKEILGEFPRLTREDALNMINSTQKSLEGVYGAPKNEMTSESNRASIPSLFDINVSVPTGLLAKNADKEKNEKPAGRERSRPSRWQSNDKEEQQQQVPLVFGLSGYYSERGDQDMRVTSNGDIDMRTLPPTMNSLIPNVTQAAPVLPLTTETNSVKDIASQDVDIRKESRDVDIRQLNLNDNRVNVLKDVDTRVYPQFDTHPNSTIQDLPELKMETSDEPKLMIVEEVQNDVEPKVDVDNRMGKEIDLPPGMPKIQRELFLRIQAQQKENLPEAALTAEIDNDQNDIDWYSDDDDDDNRLTIKDDMDTDDITEKDEIEEPPPIIQLPAPIKPMEVIEQLGDLSKIDISEEVTKLLSTISQGTSIKEPTKEPIKDPRVASRTVESLKATTPPNDPRRTRVNSTDHEKTEKVERISIYEQGSISIENASKDVDLREGRDSDLRPTFGDTDLRPPPGRPDIDLRQLGLPFKPMQNYTPATEIDGTLNSHPPIVWKVQIIDIPTPDYAGLKLSAHEAQNTGDPRLRKLFKLNIEEKDSPASPKESPKAVVTGIRADPRRRKLDDKASMNELNYSQQLNLLQTSPFYQSLTSNQKLLLNQELSSRSDHTGTMDPTLHGILATLGIVSVPHVLSPSSSATALNILTNVNNLNPMLGQPSGLIQVPGSLMLGPNQPFVSPQVNPNMLGQNPNMVNQIAQGVQPGLMGNGPNIPIVTDFQLNFDPRQGGLLGNAPPINYDNSNYNYGGDDFYEGNNYVEDGGGNRGRGRGRGNFRDRQRRGGGQNFRGGRNNGRNFRNRNRINRSLTPP